MPPFPSMLGGNKYGLTRSTEGHRSAIATASAYVSGLRMRSSALRFPNEGPSRILKTMAVSGPKLRNTPVIAPSNPVRIDPTPMMVPTPMITPSTVRNARILCSRIVCSASPMSEPMVPNPARKLIA